jgi:hypothetical protein
MKLIELTPITDARLVASSVPEDPSPAWAPGTYAALDRVHRPERHEVYERLLDGPSTAPPEADPDGWALVGPTNRWAMFDARSGTRTTAQDLIRVTLAPGVVRGLGLVELRGAEVNIVQREADASANLVRNPLDLRAANWLPVGLLPPTPAQARDGSLTAVTLVANTEPVAHYLDEMLPGLQEGELFSASCEMRAEGTPRLRLGVVVKNGSGPVIEWDTEARALVIQSPGTGQAGVMFDAVELEDGWVRLSIGNISTLTGSVVPRVRPSCRLPPAFDAPGDGVAGVRVAQVMVGRTVEPQPFQPATLYARTISLIRRPDVTDWLTFFAQPINPDKRAVDLRLLPLTNTHLEVTLYGVGPVSIGALGVGAVHEGWGTLYGLDQGLKDFSARVTDRFGVTRLEPGPGTNSNRMTLQVPAARSDALIDRIDSLRGKPVMVLASEAYPSTLGLGWFEDARRVFPSPGLHLVSCRFETLA